MLFRERMSYSSAQRVAHPRARERIVAVYGPDGVPAVASSSPRLSTGSSLARVRAGAFAALTCRELQVCVVNRQRIVTAMEDARPFCAHPEPTVTRNVDGREIVTCPECGAIGPRALPDDPAGQALIMWNMRFGMDH